MSVAIGGALSVRSREELSSFISASVLPQTNQVYSKEFTLWREFVRVETGSDDPFLQKDMTDIEKAGLVSLMMLRRHQSGKRGKAATSFTAAIRLMFARRMLPTGFLDSAVIATARSSCAMKPEELRAKKDRGHPSSVKLPVCEDIINDLKSRLVQEDDWSDESMRRKATSLGATYGYEMAGRIGEYTHNERNQVNHCARVDDFTFAVAVNGSVSNVPGSGLASLKLENSREGRSVILECRVRTTSSKGKVVVKPKLIGRRSPEEATFLDDLASWLIHSGTTGKDEVFSFRSKDGKVAVLTGRAVRDELKKTCESNGLPPAYFSAHSLRKGAKTHMRAQGTTEDDRRDRGNYAAGSQVMNMTYDYASGLGPLGSNSLEGGHKLSKSDIQRLIPPARKSE
jgi:hypothetical protein